MTVSELIAALQEMPQDSEVVHWDDDFLRPVYHVLTPAKDDPGGQVILT